MKGAYKIMKIRDIASLAGVSVSTVSRYLNGGYVSKEKKEIIEKIVNEHNYKPSLYAQTLRTKVTKQIGVIIPKLNSSSISKMVSGISKVLKDAGYYLILANIDNDENQELEYLEVFDNNKIDGIVLIGTVITKKHIEIMQNIKVPCVILSQYSDLFPCVYFDNINAAKDVTREIIKGHKCPGMIASREDDISVGSERIKGYYEALETEGLKSGGLVHSGFGIEDGFENCKKLLDLNEKIDAIFCATDHIAAGALSYLIENGYKVPEDISIGCVGGTEVTNICHPKITAANLEYFNSGVAIANILLDMVRNPENKNKSSLLTRYVIERKQTTNID